MNAGDGGRVMSRRAVRVHASDDRPEREKMHGPAILARTMSVPRVRKKGTPPWQYHPRSDHHSNVACWGVLFDLLHHSELMRDHVRAGLLAFGINHVMTNFTNGKKKALDLVVCRPKAGTAPRRDAPSFAGLVGEYGLELSTDEVAILESLPAIDCHAVGAVRVALEAKAAMTEFAKARPRLYDELASSQLIVHGDTNDALAAGLVIINGSPTFLSPTANPCLSYGAPPKTTRHVQPRQLGLTVDHVRGLPRRADLTTPGFDAIAVIGLRCTNVEADPVELINTSPAPQPGDVLHYDSLVNRLIGSYAARFPMG